MDKVTLSEEELGRVIDGQARFIVLQSGTALIIRRGKERLVIDKKAEGVYNTRTVTAEEKGRP